MSQWFTMQTNSCPRLGIFKPLLLIAGLILTIWLVNLLHLSVNWGHLTIAPASTITVTGQARQDQMNQLASFNAGVEVIAPDKASATEQATTIMNQVVESVKNFGIEAKDLETTRVNVYQQDEYYGLISGSRTKGDWVASSTLTITLRPKEGEDLADRSEALLALLNDSQATSVHGPNFQLDQQQINDTELLQLAVADAKEKAELIAKTTKQKIYKIVSLTEGSNNQPVPVLYDLAAKGVAQEAAISPELEPGSSEVLKTVTITFELR